MPEELPFVSVIVPMRNEKRYIERCIRSLTAQDYPTDRFEVIVVDGGSEDGSRDVVESLCREFGVLPRTRCVQIYERCQSMRNHGQDAEADRSHSPFTIDFGVVDRPIGDARVGTKRIVQRKPGDAHIVSR